MKYGQLLIARMVSCKGADWRATAKWPDAIPNEAKEQMDRSPCAQFWEHTRPPCNNVAGRVVETGPYIRNWL